MPEKGKTDSQKLGGVVKLLRAELKKAEKALNADREYNSLGGNGCNSAEAFRVLQPIIEHVNQIVEES